MTNTTKSQSELDIRSTTPAILKGDFRVWVEREGEFPAVIAYKNTALAAKRLYNKVHVLHPEAKSYGFEKIQPGYADGSVPAHGTDAGWEW